MAFLNPILLLGIAAVSIPIVIHLLNKRKFEKVVWAAMRFLQISVQQNQRRLRFEDLLLLILRCALLVLLAIALARPAVRAAGAAGLFGQAKVTSVIIVDNSYSMSQTDGVSSRFDRAKQAAAQVIDSLPSGSSAAVILASDVADPVIPEPTYDLALARKTIAEAKLCDRPTNLFRAVSDGLDILKKKGGLRRELYLATDGQQIGFRQLDDVCKSLDEARGDVKAHVLLVGPPETENLAVTDLRMGSDIPAVNVPLPFIAEVTNFGQSAAANVRVSLGMDGEPPSADATIADIPPGQTRGISLTAKLRTDKYHSVTASIPADHLPADDSRTIAVKAVSKVNVLLVDGDPGQEARDSETFFVRHALIPVPRAEADDYLIKCTTVTVADVANQKFDDFDVVLLANVSDLSDRELEDLAGYVRRGGGLIVFPGSNVQPEFYNGKMLGKYGLLPAAIGDAKGDEKKQDQFVTFRVKDLDHPIVSLWTDPAAGDLSAVRFFKYFTLAPKPRDPANPDMGDPRTILSLSDGSPAIVERPWGQGRVVEFCSTADTDWNTLPDHAGVWVPLLYRTLGWMLLQQDGRLNVKVGQPFVFHPGLESINKEATINRPGGAAGGRDSRQVGLDAHSVPTLTYEETSLAGTYDVSFGGGDPVKFAAQPDSSESSLEPISDAQKQKLAASAQVIDWKPGVQLNESLDKERVGTELWLPIAVAALMIATAETFLADWFSRPK